MTNRKNLNKLNKNLVLFSGCLNHTVCIFRQPEKIFYHTQKQFKSI